MKIVFCVLCLALLIVLAISLPKYRKDITTANDKLSLHDTKIINTSVAPVEYYRKGQGETVLVSHGVTGGFDQGLGLARQYMGENYDVIAVSRFGYLKSPLPEDSTPEAQAKAYKEVLDGLGVDKAFILGNSAGTGAAVKFALNYPERCKGVIFVSANVPVEKAVTLPPKPVMKVVFGSNFVYWSSIGIGKYNMLSAMGLSKPFVETLTKEKKDELLNEILKPALPVNKRTKGILNDLFLSNPEINKPEYRFEDIKVPVIMLHAMDDTLCSYEGAVAVSKRIPDIRFIDFETGGHLIMFHEEEIQKEIANFTKTAAVKY